MSSSLTCACERPLAFARRSTVFFVRVETMIPNCVRLFVRCILCSRFYCQSCRLRDIPSPFCQGGNGLCAVDERAGEEATGEVVPLRKAVAE